MVISRERKAMLRSWNSPDPLRSHFYTATKRCHSAWTAKMPKGKKKITAQKELSPFKFVPSHPEAGCFALSVRFHQ